MSVYEYEAIENRRPPCIRQCRETVHQSFDCVIIQTDGFQIGGQRITSAGAYFASEALGFVVGKALDINAARSSGEKF
ncbi:hypothetical protein M7I_6412 [Glarea lozoyensis 74030]|uniref:Uncharacterized protein n=1 Tax=Glarea lozoyensis (strain ATCC 74030 / MF5533) TaxID=1104152 RepID=H0EUI6_GLAL7|nr:hypothetical protein M7I_6412 [Glarea lozoyensis 74030]